ncbi:putative hypothetical protein Cj0837c [Helicobacter mustelae 12198]|uniref:Ferrochelatase n=1 Tax=Helicobacter mustelae (strain ATCC 43772 / CCUG 25715 / CIP 103759 / LMG 18044 / NCTC 12198 / R85-136P) TaxID=679897 RepID=D3UJJ0_HELM1|nr:putative hypothetical protein Cj0837c [Helicobacter mustelae 12198]
MNQMIELMQGKLHNAPAIDAFSGISFALNALKKGDLFFAKNIQEIDAAIAMGAYGIVYDQSVLINDVEIAWIEVKNIEEAISRLLRYFLLSKKIEAFCLKDLEFAIFKQICTDANVLIYDENLEEIVSLLFCEENLYKAILFSQKKPLQYILDSTPSIVPQESLLDIRVATLFDLRFYYKFLHYHINLPVLFAQDLCAVLYLCENYQIQYDLSALKELAAIKPNFIDSTPRLVDYGKSNKVLIAQEELQDFKKYLKYIALNGKWGRIMTFLPKDCAEELPFPALFYGDKEDLYSFFQQENFHFGLVFGIKNEDLTHLLQSHAPKIMASLFDEF